MLAEKTLLRADPAPVHTVRLLCSCLSRKDLCFSVRVKNSTRPVTLRPPEEQRVGCSFSAHYKATVCLIGVAKLHLGELTPQTACSSWGVHSLHSFKLSVLFWAVGLLGLFNSWLLSVVYVLGSRPFWSGEGHSLLDLDIIYWSDKRQHSLFKQLKMTCVWYQSGN